MPATHSAWYNSAKTAHSFHTICPLSDHALHLGSICRCPLHRQDMLAKAVTPLMGAARPYGTTIYNRRIMPPSISELQLAFEDTKVCEWVSKVYLFLGKGFSLPHAWGWQAISRKQHRNLETLTLGILCKEGAVSSCFGLLTLTGHAQLPVGVFFSLHFFSVFFGCSS